MKNNLLLLLSVILISSALFSACGTPPAESELSAYSEQNSDESVTAVSKSPISSAEGNTEISASAESEPVSAPLDESSEEALDEDGVITVTAEHGRYILDIENQYGYYEIGMKMQDGGMLLDDGGFIPLIYEDVLHEESGYSRTVSVNGRKHSLTSFSDSEGRLCQLLECVEESELSVTSKITYYPETEHGIATIGFKLESDGENFSLTYFDGKIYGLSLEYNEETKEYSVKEKYLFEN
ncbi:MAG: hypothetical protein J6R45_02635 [Clostridia bacterium]|nr:hypothetical protein [Clostridia bacterium]